MNQITSKHEKKSISDIVRKNIWFVYLILLNIIIRIPRTSGLLGADSFILIAIGTILSEGYFESYFLSPVSFFGLYTFGSYPIGVPFVVSVLLGMGLSREIIVLGISMTCSIIGSVGAYFLGTRLFEEYEYVILFTSFYSLSHLFYRFTYFSISARGPFLALLPWFLLFGINFLRERKLKWIILTVVSFIVLALIHGLAIFLIVYPCVVGAFFFCKYLLSSRFIEVIKDRFNVSSSGDSNSFMQRNMFYWIFIIISLIGSFYIGANLFHIDEDKITPLFFSNDSIIGLTFNIIIDYGLRLGVLCVFFPLGVIRVFSKYRRHPIGVTHFTLLCIMMFTIPRSLYASVLFLPVFGYYSIIGFDVIRERVSIFFLGGTLCGISFLYTLLYNSIVVPLYMWVLILAICPFVIFCIMLLSFSLKGKLPLRGRKIPQKFGIHLIILSILVFSLTTSEGLNLQSDYTVMSADEKQIIEYLLAQDDIGLTFIFTPPVTAHIGSYGIPTIPMQSGIRSMYFGLVNSSDIIANSHLDILDLFRSGKLYRYDGTDPADEIYNTLFNLDLTIQMKYEVAIALGLQYVIVEKDQLGYSSGYKIGGESYHCELLRTAPLACESILETETMSLFRLYP